MSRIEVSQLKKARTVINNWIGMKENQYGDFEIAVEALSMESPKRGNKKSRRKLRRSKR